MKGALHTRHQAFTIALREKWVRVSRCGRAHWLPWNDIKGRIKRLHSTHVQVAKDELIHRLNYTCSSLDAAFLRRLKHGLLIEATKRIASFSPAGAISLLRLFLNGLPVSRHLPLLEQEPGWTWLQQEKYELCTIMTLMGETESNTSMHRKLARLLVRCRLNCRHAKSEEESSPIQVIARQLELQQLKRPARLNDAHLTVLGEIAHKITVKVPTRRSDTINTYTQLQ
eukprot:6491691-Amphidinium_carterae.1